MCYLIQSLVAFEESKRSNAAAADVLRELDELWYHLLLSEEVNRLKRDAVLNIDFLMSSVRCASVHFLKSILELVSGNVVDFEVELMHNMLKHCIHSVSLDTNQLATEILMWLKPFSSSPCVLSSATTSPTSFSATLKTFDSEEIQSKTLFIDRLIQETRGWCLKLSHPFLVPTNAWLHLPLPNQFKVITCPWATTGRAVLTRDSQNMIACSGTNWYLFHLASRTLKKSFQGIQVFLCQYLFLCWRFLPLLLIASCEIYKSSLFSSQYYLFFR